MKILIISLLLTFSFFNIANALPVPALIIGGDIFLFIIPSIIGVLSFLFFYFYKRIFYINIINFLLLIILYGLYYLVTKETLLLNFEYYFLIILLILLFISHKFKSLQNFLLLILVGINIFIVFIGLDAFKYYSMYTKYVKIVGESNIEYKEIKNNYLLIKPIGVKEVSVTDCYEGYNKHIKTKYEGLLLRKSQEVNEKKRKGNKYCFYGRQYIYEHKVLYDIVNEVGNKN